MEVWRKDPFAVAIPDSFIVVRTDGIIPCLKGSVGTYQCHM